MISIVIFLSTLKMKRKCIDFCWIKQQTLCFYFPQSDQPQMLETVHLHSHYKVQFPFSALRLHNMDTLQIVLTVQQFKLPINHIYYEITKSRKSSQLKILKEFSANQSQRSCLFYQKSKHIKLILILNIYLKNKHKIYDLGVQSWATHVVETVMSCGAWQLLCGREGNSAEVVEAAQRMVGCCLAAATTTDIYTSRLSKTAEL